MRLENKVAIVTGSGRGIGAALAEAFAREGAAVVVNYAASEAAAGQVVKRIRDAGGRAIAHRADVGDLAAHAGLIERAVSEFGALDILVNNAAIDRRSPFLEAKPEHWDEVFGVDLKGPYFLAQCAARWMVKTNRAGAILNIASVHDVRAHRNNSLYTVAKGGLKMMTRCLALELAEYGIRVNSLSPGAIATDINREVLSDDAFRQQVIGKIPLGRIGSVEEMAGAAILLVSGEGSYITGTTLYADGGLLL